MSNVLLKSASRRYAQRVANLLRDLANRRGILSGKADEMLDTVKLQLIGRDKQKLTLTRFRDYCDDVR